MTDATETCDTCGDEGIVDVDIPDARGEHTTTEEPCPDCQTCPDCPTCQDDDDGVVSW